MATRVVRAAVPMALAAGVFVTTLLLDNTTLSSHTPITTKIVFQKEIAQIFQRKCFQCHTPGNLAMSLTTYKDARPWAVAIKEEILERRMPPWSAVSGYGHFANDMSLTGREVSLILSWADGGAPSGVLFADESKPPVFVPPLSAWEQGRPDAIVKVGPARKIDASSKDETTRLDVNTDLSQVKWLRALQVKPADRRVIRYAAVYLADTGQWLGTWTPGHQVSALPTGVALRLPPRAKLTIELGFRGTDEASTSDAELGLYFADSRPAQVASPIEVTSAVQSVATGSGVRVRGELTLKSAITTAALWPTLGPGGRSLELTAIRPDGVVEPMLWLKSYRGDWPSPYVLRDPVSLPSGTRLVVTAYYDNAGAAAIKAQPSVAITAWAPSPPTATPAR